MKTIYKEIEKNIQMIKKQYHNSSDLFSRTITIGNKKIAFIILESVSSDDKISNFFMKGINNDLKELDSISIDQLFLTLENNIVNSKITKIHTWEDIYYYLPSGFTILFVEGESSCIAIETKATLDRGVSDSNNEVVLRGPKDSFTENHMINIGLIRKRIKDPKLLFIDHKIGRRTKTKVTLAYLDDVVKEEKVKMIETKLNQIDIDGILDSGYIKEFLNNQKTAFPKVISTERPDLVSMALLEGKMVILVENTPIALIIPGVLVDYFHNPEDNYLNPINSSFTRLIRVLSFLVTLLTPAIYVSLITFNKNLIPTPVFEALTLQRKDLFVSAFIEIFLLVTIFEILRESDIRIPNKMGTSIGVVGALVLGDAAVSAGLVSSIAVIITAITAISGLLFTDIDFVYALRLWRYLFLIGAAFGGLIGVGVVFILLIIHLAHLKTVDIPYLSPIYPLSLPDLKRMVFRISKQDDIYRPTYLNTKNKERKK